MNQKHPPTTSPQPLAAPAAPAGLARVVAARASRQRDLSIAQQVRGLADSVRAADAGLEGAARAWAKVVPAHLAQSCRIEALSRGVLRVRVTDSGARFELDRFLRAGGESRVIGASPAPIRAVKLQS